MPIHALSAKTGLKKALRQLSDRVPPLRTAGGLSLPLSLSRSLPASLPLSLPALRRQTGAPLPDPDAPLQIKDVLSIPVVETNAEDAASDKAIAEGQYLARQDRWDEVEHRITAADAAGDATPGGAPIADLIAYGARADVINALDHALSAGVALSDKVTLDGIMSLERVRLDCARSPVLSTVVALAHLDISWAFQRSSARPQEPQTANLQARATAHHSRARALLSQIPVDGAKHRFQQAAQCALYSGGRTAEVRGIADEYFDLIRLDPANPRHLRALGTHLAEQGAEGLAALELEARRAAVLTTDHWGEAGYTWVYFDVLARSDAACALVDPQFFVDGFVDIVERAPNQDRINLLSAYCCISLRSAPHATPEANRLRQDIAEAADWLIRKHLREVQPMIWAHAAAGFDNDAQVASLRQFAERGKDAAFQAIAKLFRTEIEAGQRVVFTETGPELFPA
ncbi:hypothetical protein [Tritonibacter horizontis]|uniref:Uncharacterized protein n=1 Tax=Tritonibacter horizontis TaxID=1768241 RepID=A0A132BZK2_9RHOB|nr:hypothetical protein [Tritonibacter horizontis]KUP93791.1 hypothetical protein TRIHO_12830 [Tritonibacter horizontis]